MNKYRTYLFDFDYTLADSSKGIVLCFQNVLHNNGYTDVDNHTIKRTIFYLCTRNQVYTYWLTGVKVNCKML